jgi:hypothetical protein
MSEHHQRDLEALGRRLEAKGLWFKPRAYFASNGILVATPPVSHPLPPSLSTEYGPEHIQVLHSTVFLYHSKEGWEARVTRHGGDDWVRRVATLDELEAAALEALGARETHLRPPGPEWFRE